METKLEKASSLYIQKEYKKALTLCKEILNNQEDFELINVVILMSKIMLSLREKDEFLRYIKQASEI